MSSTDTTVVITVRLDPEDRARIDRLAEEVAALRSQSRPGLTAFAGLQSGEAVIPAAYDPFAKPA